MKLPNLDVLVDGDLTGIHSEQAGLFIEISVRTVSGCTLRFIAYNERGTPVKVVWAPLMLRAGSVSAENFPTLGEIDRATFDGQTLLVEGDFGTLSVDAGKFEPVDTDLSSD